MSQCNLIIEHSTVYTTLKISSSTDLGFICAEQNASSNSKGKTSFPPNCISCSLLILYLDELQEKGKRRRKENVCV